MCCQTHDETQKTAVQAEIYRGFSDAILDDFDLKRRWKPGLIRLFPQRNASVGLTRLSELKFKINQVKFPVKDCNC